MSKQMHTPGPWKVLRNSRTLKFHAARETNDGTEFLVTPNGMPRAFKSGDAARAAIAKAKGQV